MNDPRASYLSDMVEKTVLKIISDYERLLSWRDNEIAELKGRILLLEKDNSDLEEEIVRMENDIAEYEDSTTEIGSGHGA